MLLHQNLTAVFCLLFVTTINIKIAQAQVIPDNTLGSENSVINSVNKFRDRISGGAIRGENLFHSFQEFSISNSLEVYFANPEGITNIFSRVTGNNISEILGTLGVEGSANLFFLNPNGIIFAENASLDIGGSFIATTGNSIEFADGTSFAVPSNNPNITLTISVPIALGLGSSPGSIVVQGTGNNLSIPIPEFNIVRDNRPVGIKVKAGQTLGLLGGDITLEGGNLTAEEGRIELGSIDAGEQVGLTSVSEGWKFNYEGVSEFQDISLLQEASIDTSGNSSGAIQVRGQQINIIDGSAILANTLDGTGGNITIESDDLRMSGVTSDRFVSVIASDNVDGQGGNLNINTEQLYMGDGSQIRAIVFGSGTTGELNITADDIEVTGINPLNFDYLTSIETSVATESIGGIGRDVNINTKNLRITGGGRILTDTFGFGEAGNLVINADTIEIIEFNNRDLSLLTGLSNIARSESAGGNAGDITINTTILRLVNGGIIRADTASVGNGGDINIKAQNIELLGINPINTNAASRISSSSRNRGNGGNITINTNSLKLADGGQINTSTRKSGKAGKINIEAQNINIEGFNSIRSNNVSGLFASAQSSSSGNGGDININTDQLQVINGARIDTETSGLGKAGNININAHSIEFSGTRPEKGFFISGLNSSTRSQVESGIGGDININTDSLAIRQGSQIRAFSLGAGDAGNINIDAKEVIISDPNQFGFEDRPSGLLAATAGTGAGGEISLNTPIFRLADQAFIESSTFSRGNAGKIIIEGDKINIDEGSVLARSTSDGEAGNIEIYSDSLNLDRGLIAASSEEAGGGNITLNSDLIQLQNNSLISTSAGGEGNGGNITITADNFTALESSKVTANALQGNGGNIFIDTTGYFVSDDFVISASSELGLDGTITIKTPENDFQKDLEFSKIEIVSLPDFFTPRCQNPERAKLNIDTGQHLPTDPDNYFTSPQTSSIDFPPELEQKLDQFQGDLESSPEAEPEKKSPVLWKPGEPIINATEVLRTEDGRVFLVPPKEQPEKDFICSSKS